MGDRFPTAREMEVLPRNLYGVRRSGGARFPLELEARGPELSSLSSLVILPVPDCRVCRVVTVHLSSVNPFTEKRSAHFFPSVSGACEDETW